MKIPRHQALFLTSHLSELQVLAYLDGELRPEERESAKNHLDGCWPCRSLMSEVQGSIETFVKVRKEHLPEETVFSESRVEQFRQRLIRHANEAESMQLPWKESWRRRAARAQNTAMFLLRPRQVVIAVSLIATLLTVMFTDVLTTRVSADTVLARADQYQVAHLPMKGRVSRTSVRVDRIESAGKRVKPLGTVNIVRDSLTPEAYVQTQSVSGEVERSVIAGGNGASANLLHAILSAENPPLERYLNAAKWVPDLSVAEFRRLAGEPGMERVSARRQGQAFEVSYQFTAGHPSGLAEGLLQVDALDYAPASVSFITADQNSRREYRFTRTSVSEELRTEEVAELFGLRQSADRVNPGTRELPSLSRPVPLSYVGSLATASEVKVAETLHGADACLGEEVYIFPMSDGTLLVQGLVENAVRRAAIVRSLTPMANVRVKIYLPREIKSGSDLFAPPERFDGRILAGNAGGADATLADLSSGQSPLYDRLTRHFLQSGASPEDAGKQVAIFSNEVVTTARQTFLHAWALKRLDGEFSKARVSHLPDSALKVIDQMREDHRRWIGTLAQRESEMLTPIAASPLALNSLPINVELDTDTLLHLAAEQNELVRALFAPSRQSHEADANLNRLLTVARRMGS